MNLNFKEVNILQHVDYEVHPIDLKLTDTVLVSTGIYKPSIKIHTLNELCLKNERCIENQAKKIETMSDDALKLAILRTDRYVEIHAKYGMHSSIRIPSNGIDLYFNKVTADLIILGKKGVYRFNLEQGRFLKELCATESCESLYSMGCTMTHGIISIGKENRVDFYDYRSKNKIGSVLDESIVSSLDFHENGMNLITGNFDGNIILYDLRKMEKVKELIGNEKHAEITKIKFNGDFACASSLNCLNFYKIRNFVYEESEMCGEKKIEENNIDSSGFISCDNITSFDSKGGLVFVSCESNQNIKSYYSNLLGEAPKWCKFIETEI